MGISKYQLQTWVGNRVVLALTNCDKSTDEGAVTDIA